MPNKIRQVQANEHTSTPEHTCLNEGNYVCDAGEPVNREKD
jgi:hypothetical protein